MPTLTSSWQIIASTDGSNGKHVRMYARAEENTIANTSTIYTWLGVAVDSGHTWSVSSWSAGLDGTQGTSGGSTTWGEGEHGLLEGSYTVNHNADGTGSVTIHGAFNSTYGITSWNPSVACTLQTIDRVGATCGAYYSSKTHNSITLRLTSDSMSNVYCYRINGGSWQYVDCSGTDVDKVGGGTIYKTFTGLSPNTSYTIEVQFKRKINEVWGNVASSTNTTNKPSAPSAGSVSVSEITPFSAKFTLSGSWSFGSDATWGEYQQAFDNEDWQSMGQNTTITRTGLTPETSYKFWVRLVDNYGTPSESATVTFTTLTDQAKAYVKVDGAWKKGKAYVKVNGAWKKAKEVYVKVNGSWKKEI